MSIPTDGFTLPVGTVTFLLTDVSGSTSLWERESDANMRAAIVRHYEILTEAIDRHDGIRPQEQGEGDSVVAAFARPTDALAAAADAQVALALEPWPTDEPLTVRMGVHTGEAHLRDEHNYAGQAIIRAARLRNVGHGGQVLVSGTTRDLAVDQDHDRIELRWLGEHRLRDLDRPEQVWQLVVPGLLDRFPELATTNTVPNTLPLSLSPFIGRDGEVDTLASLVTTERLVTVTGSGGVGKTRLAQQVGAAVVAHFPAGVWWVELAPLGPDGVEPALRAAFGISEGSSTPFPEAVRRRLDNQACLLIVDNCEHVAEAVSAPLTELLAHAPKLHVLATSRVMLDVPGESAWRVPPLSLPDPSGTDLDALTRSDAVELFCDRAQRARPNFRLTSENGRAVAAICQRVDGMPLAIELAAARCRMLDPDRILAGLDDAFRILAGGSKSLLPRQQTLEASITWSYELLSPAEQTLLVRLAVFVDGWTLDQAEAICPEPPDVPDPSLQPMAVFDALDRLVDHSLIHTTESPAGLRFALLETVRQYARRQIETRPDERDALRRRHSEHFTGWIGSVGQALIADPSDDLLARLFADQANLLAATESAIDTGEPSRALDALVALGPAMELDAWTAPAALVAGQADRLATMVEAQDEWRVLLVRQKALTLIGNPLAELDVFARMERSAELVGSSLGVAVARVGMLSLFSLSGAPVLDELLAVGDDLVACDPRWRNRLAIAMGLFAAYQGRLDLSDRAVAVVGDDLRNPATRGIVDGIRGMNAYLRGDASAARRLLEASQASQFGYRGGRTLLASFLALAGADLGLDLTEEIERDLRRRAEVDGNEMDGFTADWLLGVRALLADDLDLARDLIVRCSERAAGTGVIGNGPNERYALVAAGHDDAILAPDDPVAGPTFIVSNLRARAERCLQANDPGAASLLVHQSLEVGLGYDLQRGLVLTLECLARILTAAGRHAEATRLRGACQATRVAHGTSTYPCLQRLLDAAALTSRTALGDAEHDDAMAEGASLSLDEAVRYAGRLRVSHLRATVGWESLTPTEARVAELVAEGLTNAQVATELIMGSETVKTHLSRVFQKVGVANRKELIVAASRRSADTHR